MRLPELVAHADWSANPPGRQIAIARRVGPRYTASAVRPVGTLSDLLPELLAEAGPNGTALLGVDFPIGLPQAYATKADIVDFRDALKKFGRARWSSFYDPAATRAEIALTRPFYPARPGPKGSVRREDLPEALGLDSYDFLHRLCDRGHPDRSAAAVLFWTLGGNQVGKAAISGWRDVIAPALRGLRGRRAPVRLWPFDGSLERLLEQPGIVVVETYPGEIYSHFSMEIAAPHRSKRRQDDRGSEAPVLIGAAKHLDIDLADSLCGMIKEGFGSQRGGDDRFDAVVGLLGMINVLRGCRAPGDPNDHTRRTIEGWILGQTDTSGHHGGLTAASTD